MALDSAKNFAKVTVSSGYASGITSIDVSDGTKLPTVPFNATWWNFTDYPDPSDDPNVEIVRVTNIATNTLTITRAQEGTSDVNHNTGGKTYKLIAGMTAKTVNTDIPALAFSVSLIRDPFTGSSGASQAFDLSANLATGTAASVVGVYYSGVLQQTTVWEVTDSNTITCTPAPGTDVDVQIIYYAVLPASITGVHVEVDTGDNSTTDFALAQTAVANGLIGGFVDGILQSGATLIDGGTKIRYATAPFTDTVVQSIILY